MKFGGTGERVAVYQTGDAGLATALDATDAFRKELVRHRERVATHGRRGWIMRRALVAADALGITLAFAISSIAFPTDSGDRIQPSGEVLLFVLTLPMWLLLAKLQGLYERDEERTDHSTADDFAAVFHMVTVCVGLVTVVAYLSDVAHPSVHKLVIFWAFAIALVCVGRAGARTLARRNAAYVQNTVIVGAGDVGQLFAKKLVIHPEYGMNLVGFVDAQPKKRREDLEHLALLGDVERLPAIVRLLDVERVIVAFSNESHNETLDLLRDLNDLDVQIDIVPRLFEFVGPGVEVHTVEGLPLIGLPPFRLSRSSRFVKRTTDLALTIPALLFLAPL